MWDTTDPYRPFSAGCYFILLVLGTIFVACEWCGQCIGVLPDDEEEAISEAARFADADAASSAPTFDLARGPPGSDEGAEPSRCGTPGHAPPSADRDAWHRYRCEPRAQAAGRWSACLPRAAYSDSPGTGCPGASGTSSEERCCPPPDG